jgi:hypothetical protein
MNTKALKVNTMTSTHLALVQADRIVVSMNLALEALSQAKTIGEIKLIVDVAAAAEIYAARQHLGEETEALAVAVKVEAVRELGAVLKVTPKATGLAGQFTGGIQAAPPVKDAPTYAELGLSKKEAAFAQKLAELPEAEFQRVRNGTVSAANAVAAATAAKKAAEEAAKAAAKPVPATPAQQAKGNKAAQQAEAEAQAEEAFGDFDALKAFETAQAEIEALQKVIAAAEADDKKAELMKWRRAYDAAVHGQSAAMDRAHKSVEREKWTARQLARCGKALGVDDPTKIAAAVGAMARQSLVAPHAML